MAELRGRLAGGDRRSIGNAGEVVDHVLANPISFAELFDCMSAEDPVVRMRAADAVEKVTAQRPDWLQSYKAILIQEIAASKQQEVRWHVAQMITRLELEKADVPVVVEILIDYLDDKSMIVKTFSLQALTDLALANSELRTRVIPIVRQYTRAGSPAVRSRGRKLLQALVDAGPTQESTR